MVNQRLSFFSTNCFSTSANTNEDSGSALILMTLPSDSNY